jgi:hypothetical protein
MTGSLYRTEINCSEYGIEYKCYANNLINIIESSQDQEIVNSAIQEAKEITAEDVLYVQEVREIRDYALLNMGVKLAERKEFDIAVTLLTSVKSFDKMASAFQEICHHIENQYQLERVKEAAKNTLNQGSRNRMTLGEMKKLPNLLHNTLNYLSSFGFDLT